MIYLSPKKYIFVIFNNIYDFIDYGQFTLSSVNNNNNRLKTQPQPQPQHQPQIQQDAFRVAAPLQQPTQRYQANTFVPEYNLKVNVLIKLN